MRPEVDWTSGRLCVLLVDDNVADCELVQEAVAAQGRPVSVLAVHDGRTALQWLDEQADRCALPDVLLLDIRMPGMGGLEVLRAVRDSAALYRLPVVMLSTSADERDVRQAYDLMTTGYLVKAKAFGEFADQMGRFVRHWSDVKFPVSRGYGA
ncbi:response regulator [Deinococcus sp. JMULE3]|uniref:response regulator n=1 Tax=Deinococcus sp. JMULE3 TaxID=2518341 RepID=UPI001576F4F6|nr:response regulator [Deinococcus sp. JMULE3]NTY01666.1 response regulator [Deinococcus sp. JMULE3]